MYRHALKDAVNVCCGIIIPVAQPLARGRLSLPHPKTRIDRRQPRVVSVAQLHPLRALQYFDPPEVGVHCAARLARRPRHRRGGWRVRMYVCGPTVYDYAHIGNARPAIVFDVLYHRLLRHVYGETHVVYARNITDVDDKINARAARDFPGVPLNEAIAKVTRSHSAQYQHDVTALGCLPPTFQPHATEYIAEMRVLIDQLVSRGHAYVADGHVLFDVSSMPDYGRLANRSLDEMEAGARVDVAPLQEGADGFRALETIEARRAVLGSPAGLATAGRPGWHVECSAMAGALLGEVFDIHAGRIDLVFPHHTRTR
ncbi:MAG: hypothetical protein R3E48_23105 [Burkholderiaceae bacterium]